VGVLTENEPFCVVSDCVVDECSETVKELIYDTEAYCNEQCQAGFGGYACPSQWQARWVRDYEHLKAWINKILRKRYSYSISFIGNKQIRIEVTCASYFYAYTTHYYRWERQQSALGSCWPTFDEACAETPTGWALIPGQETTEGTIGGPALSCCWEGQPGEPQQVGKGNCMGYTTLFTPCTSEASECYYIAKCEAVYSKEFTLDECSDFYGTFTLDRTNESCGQEVTLSWFGWFRRQKGSIFNPPIRNLCIGEPCTPLTSYTIDDCWPSTLDVTIA
jgi:hypothetical protein